MIKFYIKVFNFNLSCVNLWIVIIIRGPIDICWTTLHVQARVETSLSNTNLAFLRIFKIPKAPILAQRQQKIWVNFYWSYHNHAIFGLSSNDPMLSISSLFPLVKLPHDYENHLCLCLYRLGSCQGQMTFTNCIVHMGQKALNSYLGKWGGGWG